MKELTCPECKGNSIVTNESLMAVQPVEGIDAGGHVVYGVAEILWGSSLSDKDGRNNLLFECRDCQHQFVVEGVTE